MRDFVEVKRRQKSRAYVGDFDGKAMQHRIRRPGEMMNPVHHLGPKLGAPGEGTVQMHRIPVGRQPREWDLIARTETAACKRLVDHLMSRGPIIVPAKSKVRPRALF